MKTNAALKKGRSVNGNGSAGHTDPKEIAGDDEARTETPLDGLDPQMTANPENENGAKPDGKFINAVIEEVQKWLLTPALAERLESPDAMGLVNAVSYTEKHGAQLDPSDDLLAI